jgi:hypothetical protein
LVPAEWMWRNVNADPKADTEKCPGCRGGDCV